MFFVLGMMGGQRDKLVPCVVLRYFFICKAFIFGCSSVKCQNVIKKLKGGKCLLLGRCSVQHLDFL